MSLTQSKARVQVFRDDHALSEAVVAKVLSLSQRAIRERGRFSLVSCGSPAASRVYAFMASTAYRNEFDWENIHLFWADEEWVEPTDRRSRYRMVAETLLTRVDIPLENIHPIRRHPGGPLLSAEQYEKQIISFFQLPEGEYARFDLVLLHVDTGGRMASYLPCAGGSESERRMVVAGLSESSGRRIGLTLSALNHADQIWWLASGREKAALLQRILESPEECHALPHLKLQPEGTVSWFLDGAAASLLTS